MINISMSHPVPTFGDSFTVTCYVCGMPSSKEWAQKARSRPTTPHKPYFPFLLQISPIGGAILREDGSTYLCAFCHASLEAQWNIYESQQVIPPPNRKYNIQKFICAVCGVETYRKRIRALPFQEFPFLEKQRQPGSITLGNNPLAIVCLDCSETLWAQSAEYDRWGLPVHKRHFNWMARPPPPEDSVEATVARLPSGETQLPRCPPIEPSITPSKAAESPSSSGGGGGVKSLVETQISSKSRGKGKGESPKLMGDPHNYPNSPTAQTSRKSSLTSTTPPSMDLGGFHSQQPPVVTVAPMSSHTTVISLRKDSLSLPSGLLPPQHPGIFPQPTTAVYPPAASYSPYVWGNTTREPTQRPAIEAYPYTGPAGAEAIAGPWPWLPHPSSDLLRYQSYMNSLQNRSRLVESSASGSPTHSSSASAAARSFSSPSGPYIGAGGGASPSSEPRYQSASLSAPSTAVSGALREHDRIILEEQRQVEAINSERGVATTGRYELPEIVYQQQRKGSPDPNIVVASIKTNAGKKSPKILPQASSEKPSTSGSSKLYPSHPKKSKESYSPRPQQTISGSGGEIGESQVNMAAPSAPSSSASVDSGGDDQDKMLRREYHLPKKRNWHVFMKESQATSSGGNLSGGEEGTKSRESPPPPQAMHHPKKKKTSLSECSVDGIGGGGSPRRSGSRSTSDSAMDLSVTLAPRSQEALKGSRANSKFRIEYLCQSTTASSTDNTSSQPGGGTDAGIGGGDDIANRTSVIRCAPKVPPVVDEVNSEGEDNEETDKMEVEDKGGDKKEAQLVKNSEGDKEKDEDDKKEEMDESKETQDKVVEGSDNKNKEGKSEKQLEILQEGSTIPPDDNHDDDKHEDLPNIEQFIKETVLELVSREKEREKVEEEEGHEQKQFLNELGLITPEKKIDLEIKSIVSRHERKTLPPLQLRADTKMGKKIDKELKELLLKVSLQDPTLFDDAPEAEKCDFMAELGMKTAKRSDKTKREIKWRVILMERMRRELRNCAARGVKHEWEKSDILKKFASCDLDSFFNSLSYAALKASEEDLEDKKKTVDAVEDDKSKESGSGGGVCINYPKYIPSYAVAGPSSGGSGGGNTSPSSSSAVKVEVKSGDENTNDTPPVNFAEPILKIPVVSPKGRLQSDSSTTSGSGGGATTDDSELGSPTASTAPATVSGGVGAGGIQLSFGIPSGPYPLRIDNLIQCSTSYWQQMKRSIDEILNELESSKEDVPVEDKTVQMDKLRKHLKSQLSDIKEIEKRFRATGKAIMSSARAKNKSQQKKDN